METLAAFTQTAVLIVDQNETRVVNIINPGITGYVRCLL